MDSTRREFSSSILAILSALVLCAMNCGASAAQEKRAPQSSGVENTKMGPYRALAQHAFAEFQRGDLATAAQLARVLERVWDKGEDYGGDTALKRTHPDLFEQIDKAMDDFITPLMEYKTKPPEAARVKAAFNNYVEKLQLAD
ncbi:MAG TPA: hypothetical protein VJN42_11310 [Candidatus Acidoferrum sp.]|nr:hypothetical protein [Candidatus Acidoferrum sp.]